MKWNETTHEDSWGMFSPIFLQFFFTWRLQDQELTSRVQRIENADWAFWAGRWQNGGGFGQKCNFYIALSIHWHGTKQKVHYCLVQETGWLGQASPLVFCKNKQVQSRLFSYRTMVPLMWLPSFLARTKAVIRIIKNSLRHGIHRMFKVSALVGGRVGLTSWYQDYRISKVVAVARPVEILNI